MYPLLPFSLNQPLAVDNAISTIGVIHKIIGKMNDVIDELNNIDSTANEYTDEQIRLLKIELQSKFDDIESEIVLLNGRIDLTNSNLTTLENAFNDFKVAITTSVNQLSINVANLSDYVAQTESLLINYIDNKIEILTHLIESLKGTKVLDVYGNYTSIQKAYNSLLELIGKNSKEITLSKVLSFLSNPTYTNYNVSFSTLIYSPMFSSVNHMTIQTYELITNSSPSYLAMIDGYTNFENMITNHYNFILILWALSNFNNNLLISNASLIIELFGFNSLMEKQFSYKN
ncbi:MAG: hypothetical protein J6T10_26000 [Methanobrevibacter sp.]|nr:hypothetical protein [Methanobrevibacter sp.]